MLVLRNTKTNGPEIWNDLLHAEVVVRCRTWLEDPVEAFSDHASHECTTRGDTHIPGERRENNKHGTDSGQELLPEEIHTWRRRPGKSVPHDVGPQAEIQRQFADSIEQPAHRLSHVVVLVLRWLSKWSQSGAIGH